MVIKEILKRRSVRSYKSDQVSDENIQEIIKAAQFAPTAYGTGAVEFVVIKDQETKNKLFEILGTEYIKQAPVLILPVATEESKLITQDISIASSFIFIQAASLNLGTVWKNLSPEWEEKVKAVLGVPNNFKAINIIPLGYSSEEISQHSEEEFSSKKIHQEKW